MTGGWHCHLSKHHHSDYLGDPASKLLNTVAEFFIPAANKIPVM